MLVNLSVQSTTPFTGTANLTIMFGSIFMYTTIYLLAFIYYIYVSATKLRLMTDIIELPGA